MKNAAEQWPSTERWEKEIERDWGNKREIPFLNRIIHVGASLRFGRSFENKEIAEKIGMSPTMYSNSIKDNLCTFDFLVKISRWLEIPVNAFAQISDLSKDYDDRYALDPLAALRDFENEARRHLHGARKTNIERVLNSPNGYQPRDSTLASIDLHLYDRDGNPIPSDRGARRIGAAEFRPDHSCRADDRFEIVVRGRPGWNVILLESQLIPYKDLDWGMLNGALPDQGTLVGPCGRDGAYSFEGIFDPPLGTYRITAAVLNSERPIEPWWRIEAGERCPAYLLEQLAEAATADAKDCFLTTFTYELIPRVRL